MQQRGRLALLLLAALAVGLSACAQDVGDIDRTQPDKIEKELFQDDDEWYFQQTVIDTTPEGQSGVSLYDSPTGRPQRTQEPIFTAQVNRRLKRIRWEIHKEVLYARATVEPVRGVTEQIDGEKHNELGIVAAFPIRSHFDVQRQYNPQTGEPTNVIVENRSDRPWHEREYMRVDWSTNLVTSLAGIGDGLFGRMSPKAAATNKRKVRQEQRIADPHRAKITEDYVDTVTEYVFNPDVYACMSNFGADSVWHCEGSVARVRNSFMRVADNKTYEPMQYRDDEPITKKGSDEPFHVADTLVGTALAPANCGSQSVQQTNRDLFGREPAELCNEASFDYFDRFGYFRTNMAVWSEERHTYEEGRKQYVNRFNIWETAFDENGERIEVSERTPEPIVFYLNADYPRDMFQSAQWVADEWNESFLQAVALAKGWGPEGTDKVAQLLKDNGHPEGRMFKIKRNGCHPSKIAEWKNNAGGKENDRADVEGIFQDYLEGVKQGRDLTETLWNMSIKKRKRMCSELQWATAERQILSQRFTWQQIGDLRYSFFSWINDYNIGWLGYGPSSADPKTGEIIKGSANFAGRLLESYAQHSADLVQYLNGELSREEIQQGLHVRDQLDENGNVVEPGSLSEDNDGEGTTEGRGQGLTPPTDGPVADKGTVKRIDIDRINESLEKERRKAAREGRPGQGKLPVEQLPPEFVQREADRIVSSSIDATAADTKMLKWLERPDVKELMMSNPMTNDSVRAMAAERIGQQGAKDTDAVHQAYLDMYAPMLREAQDRRRRRLLQKNNIFSSQAAMRMAEGLALYTGIADHLKGKPHDEIVKFFKDRIFFGTQIHEVGHTVGLRHNFSASLDALNYHDAFWEIQRAKINCRDGSEAPECNDGVLSAQEARTGGEALAEELADNPHAGYVSQAEFRLASVMDYTADSAGRFAGLGKYDQAAINFAYAKHVRQWKEDLDIPKLYPLLKDRAHYTRLPAVLADNNAQRAANACTGGLGGFVDKKCIREGIDMILNGQEWVSIEDAKKRYRKVLETNTKVAEGEAPGGDVMIRHNVDFNFCSDDRNGRSLGCQTFDWGSNQVEVLAYAFDKFRIMQPFRRYRGSEIGAQNMLVNEYYGRLLRTLSLADNPFRYYSLYKELDYNLGSLTDELEKAARLGMNFYGELLTMPRPGRHCKYSKGDLTPKADFGGTAIDVEGAYVADNTYYRADTLRGGCNTSMMIPEGTGQYFGFKWSDEYNYRINRVGSYIDKVIVASRMYQLDSSFTFASFITDARALHVSYWTEFEEPLYEMIRSLFLGDYSDFGGAIDDKGTSDPADDEYVPHRVVSLDPDNPNNQGANNNSQNLKKVYDPTSFDIRLQLIIGALAEYSSWQDNSSDFDEYVQIAASEKERQLLPEDLPAEDKAVFVHPDTNRKYVAIRAADGRSITYDMVEWANRLKTQLVEARENGADEKTLSEYEKDLENVVAKMNLIRQARATFAEEG